MVLAHNAVTTPSPNNCEIGGRKQSGNEHKLTHFWEKGANDEVLVLEERNTLAPV